MSTAEPLELGTLLMGLFGGLALFLFGMEQLSEALKAVAGERMKEILGRLTQNRLWAAATGALVTAAVQSSSVTTVLVVGLISANLMTMAQSVGVIMGANIGSTVTAQIIAFKVTRSALALVAVGFALRFFARKEAWRQRGSGILGIGLVFLGIGVMGDAMAPLRAYPPFLKAMTHMESPALGILTGTLFTALIQSSAATTGIVIVLAGQGLVTLPAGIALALGANIGTCVTALLAAIGRPREALRAATVHILFNVLGVLLWLPFIDQLAALTAWISPASPELAGTARLAAEVPRQIANAHTLFNVLNTVIFLGFAAPLARLVVRLVPDRPEPEERLVRARYLDPGMLETPFLALDRVRFEILHMGEHVSAMFEAILPAVLDGDRETLSTVESMDENVDHLHGQVIAYLGKIGQSELSEEQMQEVLRLMEAVNSLENIGDIIETNLVSLGRERLALDLRVSPATRRILEEFHAAVGRALQVSIQATTQKSERAAQPVLEMKQEINRLADAAGAHQARRLVAAEPHRLETYRLETDILQNLKRIYYFTKRMVRVAVPEVAGES